MLPQAIDLILQFLETAIIEISDAFVTLIERLLYSIPRFFPLQMGHMISEWLDAVDEAFSALAQAPQRAFARTIALNFPSPKDYKWQVITLDKAMKEFLNVFLVDGQAIVNLRVPVALRLAQFIDSRSRILKALLSGSVDRILGTFLGSIFKVGVLRIILLALRFLFLLIAQFGFFILCVVCAHFLFRVHNGEAFSSRLQQRTPRKKVRITAPDGRRRVIYRREPGGSRP